MNVKSVRNSPQVTKFFTLFLFAYACFIVKPLHISQTREAVQDPMHAVVNVLSVRANLVSFWRVTLLQGDHKFSVLLMITIQKVASNVQSGPRQSPDFIHTPKCFLEDRVQYSTVHIPNVFCDGHLQITSFLYCNLQVHTDFLITLYVC
jgi:hypothetical protein